MFSPKDPVEEITLTFDFSRITTIITNPVVTISVYSGTDANPQILLDDTAQVSQNNTVLQRVVGGLNGVNYLFKCMATTLSGDRLLHTDILPVRTEPYTS